MSSDHQYTGRLPGGPALFLGMEASHAAVRYSSKMSADFSALAAPSSPSAVSTNDVAGNSLSAGELSLRTDHLRGASAGGPA